MSLKVTQSVHKNNKNKNDEIEEGEVVNVEHQVNQALVHHCLGLPLLPEL